MIKPYYQDDYCTIYNGDCRELLPQMPKVDLVLADPVYGNKKVLKADGSVGGANQVCHKAYGKFKQWAAPDKSLINMMLDCSKNQIIWGGNYYANLLPNSSCWLVWYKENTGDFADCELAWTSFDTAVRYFKYRWNGMIQENMKNKEPRVHPTQKPLPLMTWQIEKYTKPNNIIIDPFMGSGTTLRAAKDLHRKVIGIEIEEKYCEVAALRLSQEVLDFK